MKFIFITPDDAVSMFLLLDVFNGINTSIIHPGNLSIKDVTLTWSKDRIRLILNDPPPPRDTKED